MGKKYLTVSQRARFLTAPIPFVLNGTYAFLLKALLIRGFKKRKNHFLRKSC